MNYFEFNDKRPSLDVIDWPGIEVTESELTPEQLEALRTWTQTLSDSSLPQSLLPSLALRFGL